MVLDMTSIYFTVHAADSGEPLSGQQFPTSKCASKWGNAIIAGAVKWIVRINYTEDYTPESAAAIDDKSHFELRRSVVRVPSKMTRQEALDLLAGLPDFEDGIIAVPVDCLCVPRGNGFKRCGAHIGWPVKKLRAYIARVRWWLPKS